MICTNTGVFQDPRNVVRVMKRIIKNSGVINNRFHDIRHTYASILIDQGVDIVKISKRLGHANPRITLEVYAHLLPNSDNEIADIFHNAIQRNVSNWKLSYGQNADKRVTGWSVILFFKFFVISVMIKF